MNIKYSFLASSMPLFLALQIPFSLYVIIIFSSGFLFLKLLSISGVLSSSPFIMNMASNNAKIFALDLLRDIDTNWSYEECDQYFENPNELVTADTKKILDNAILNPEVQIDFLDFLSSLPDNDKIVLLESLSDDYSNDELANMLIPVFLSMSDTETGKTALNILGNSKSQLAYHALNTSPMVTY